MAWKKECQLKDNPKEEALSEYMRNIDVLSKLFGPFLEMMAMAYDEVYEMLMD